MNYPVNPPKEFFNEIPTPQYPVLDLRETFSEFFGSYKLSEAREILSKWMEVVICSHDTLYDDWEERSSAYAFCKNLVALLEAAESFQKLCISLPGHAPQVLENPVYYLSRTEQVLLKKISISIQALIQAEMIICFGSRHLSNHAKNCWAIHSNHFQELYAFYLLVLTGPSEKRPDHEIQELLESHSRGISRLTALVHSAEFTIDRMEEGNLFFSTVLRQGVKLFDSGSLRIPETRPWMDPQEMLAGSVSSWERWSGSAQGFMRGAEFYTSGGEYRLAVFLIHQVVEHTCTGLIQALTGYRMTTHNLDKLLRVTQHFTEELAELFPRNTGEEISWFLLLQKAYTHSRYQDGYAISAEELKVLTCRARKLMERAEILYREHREVLFILADDTK